MSLLSIWFTDQNDGWIVGDQGTAFKTTNAGQTWVPQNVGTGVVLFGVTFADPSTGWITGDFGTTTHTADGSTWGAQIGNTASALFAPSFMNTLDGFCGGGNGVILKTTDGGANWTVTNTGYPRNIYLASGKSGAAVHAIGDTGLVLLSSNGGLTWGDDFAGTANNIFGLYVLNDSVAWISGDNGSVLFRGGTGGASLSRGPGKLHSGPVRDSGSIRTFPIRSIPRHRSPIRLRGSRTLILLCSTCWGAGSPSWITGEGPRAFIVSGGTGRPLQGRRPPPAYISSGSR